MENHGKFDGPLVHFAARHGCDAGTDCQEADINELALLPGSWAEESEEGIDRLW